MVCLVSCVIAVSCTEPDKNRLPVLDGGSLELSVIFDIRAPYLEYGEVRSQSGGANSEAVADAEVEFLGPRGVESSYFEFLSAAKDRGVIWTQGRCGDSLMARGYETIEGDVAYLEVRLVSEEASAHLRVASTRVGGSGSMPSRDNDIDIIGCDTAREAWFRSVGGV